MALNFKFIIAAYQDKVGEDNAQVSIAVNGSDSWSGEVVSTDPTAPDYIRFDVPDLPDDTTEVTFNVVLNNEHYIDSATDRNAHILCIGYLASDEAYFLKGRDGTGNKIIWTEEELDDMSNYIPPIPTSVTGDQIADDWWDSRESDGFYTIPIFGNAHSDEGVNIVMPVSFGA